MKIIYDPEADVLRILFQDMPISESDQDEAGIIVDFDDQGNVVGLEVLDASTRIDDLQSVSYMITKSTPHSSAKFRRKTMQSFSKREQDIIEKIRSLPPHRVWEVEDFIDFLKERSRSEPTTEEYLHLSETAFAKVWNNAEDAAYDNL